MAIDVGDAVLTFLADTTNLDEAYTRISTEGTAKMRPAVENVTALGDGWKSAGAVATESAAKMATASTVASEGAKLTGRSLRDAKGEAALLGEQFGIHLPRHVRTFIAEIPGVGAALTAAFGATAVLFIIEAVVKLGERLVALAGKQEEVAAAWKKYDSTVIESSVHMQQEIDKEEQKLIEMTDGPIAALDFALKHLQTTAFATFNEITKDLTDAVAAMNKQSGFSNVFGDAATDLEKFKKSLHEAMVEADHAHPGDTFAAYTAAITAVQEKERELTKLIAERTSASGADASAAIDGLNAERKAVNEILPLLRQGIDLQAQKNEQVAIGARLTKESNTQSNIDQAIKEGQAVLDNERKLDAAKTALARATAAEELAIAGASGAELILLNAKYAEEDYQKTLSYLRRKLELLKLDPTKNRDAVAKLNAEIEAEEIRHNAAAIESYTNLLNTLKAIHDSGVPLITASLPDQLANPLAAAFDKARAAAQAAGVTLRIDLVQALEDAKKAKADFIGTGIIDPVAVAQFNRNIADMQRNLDNFGKTEDVFRVHSRANWNQFFDAIQRGNLKTGQTFRLLGQEITASLADSVAAAVSGSQGFGQAMESILKSALGALTGIAVVHVVEELAKAASDLATIGMEWHAPLHFKAAAEWAAVGTVAGIAGALIPSGTGSSSASTSSGQTATSSPAQTAGAPPSTTQNAPHFASGGVVYQRMVAVVGDSRSGGNAREGILPLDNPHAMDAIAGAIGSRIPSGGGDTHNHIHVEVQGMVSADNLTKIVKEISRQVNRGQVRLNSSNTLRITKRA